MTTMLVNVNGTPETREVSHVEAGASAWEPALLVPVLAEGEYCMHMIGNQPPHIVRIKWPDPREGALGRSFARIAPEQPNEF